MLFKSCRAPIAGLGLAYLIVSPAQAQSGSLRVDVTRLRSDSGSVRCALYASAAGFPEDSEKGLQRTIVTPSDRRAVCRFDDVPPGAYAVAAFHDEDGDGEVDKNFLGIPKERYGFSNNPGGIGAPAFEEAQFHFAGDKSIVLRLK